MTEFIKATKKRAKARIALTGASGSGKTYTALVAAQALKNGGRIAVIDTEHGSASLYADKFDFDVLELDNFHPKNYVDAIQAAEAAKYDVIVIDSLSHAWEGEGGELEIRENAVVKNQGNSWAAWREVSPLHRDLIEAMLQSDCHIVATMRSKMDYIQVEEDGKKKIKKVGLAPVQRPGMEYEFTIVGDMDIDHNIVISKSRCELMADQVAKKPDGKFFKQLIDWLNSGEDAPVKPKPQPQAEVEVAIQSKPTRPYTPETVLEGIKKKAAIHQGKSATQEQRGLVVGMLEECFPSGDSEMRRHEVCKYLTGKSSVKDIADNQLLALIDWLSPEKDSGGAYHPNKFSVSEAEAILAKIQVENPLQAELA